ncbi:MAG TPA: GntR family transcriptional regulator [Acidimicrobiia bacterium]|jgi:GntR family transcriptional regulator|nr:GntR family transcriptional regulator [Acidimicrobiia bacterium]
MTTKTPARYEEIADHLRRLVASSRPGDRLPSDAELCERFGVSRMTARQAVQTLSNERLLYRTRGQGTFVAARPVPRVLGSPLSFTESMRSRGMSASSQVLASGKVTSSAEEAKALGLTPGESALLLERLRLADDTPMAIERVVFAMRCAAVLGADLEHGSLHDAFQVNGWIPTRAEAEVTARPATARERRLLHLGEPVVLAERRTISDQDGSPLEHTETVYAAERYVFAAVLHRDATDRLG